MPGEICFFKFKKIEIANESRVISLPHLTLITGYKHVNFF